MANPDYRLSHLDKGLDYDRDLATRPFDAYLSHWEAHHLSHWLKRQSRDLPSGVLDFACGTGRITQVLWEQLQCSIDGIDVSPSMLEVARKRCPTVNFTLADITTPHLQSAPQDAFGLITAFRFFGNAQPSLRTAALAALKRRLKRGGRLILDHHRNAGALYARLDRATGGHANGMDLTLPELTDLLRAQGLAVERTIPIGMWMWRSSLLHADSSNRSVRREQVLETMFSASHWARWSPACILIVQHAD